MDKKSQEYWKKRSQILEQATFDNTKDEYKKIAKAFDKSQKEIQAKIDKWLARIAKNNGDITLEEARELLNKNELAEFKWTVKEYIKYGEENAIDQRWMKELENASAKHHIDKLTALKLECQAEYDKAFNTENQKVSDAVKEAYTDRYDHVGYEVQKGFNVGFKLNGISEEKLDKVIRKPWAPDGKNFSDRIWTKKEQMVEELYQALVRNTLGGSNLKDVINSMTKYVDKSTKNAKSAATRLVMTESAYFASQGQKDCFNDLGVEKYEIVATLDNKTSDICQGLDGKVFEMKEFDLGVTAPPFHVNCRSTTAPYFDDEFSLGERAARGEDGKTYYVPSDMTYKEWKGKQEEIRKQDATKKPKQSNIIKLNNDDKSEDKNEKVNVNSQRNENNSEIDKVLEFYVSGEGMYINQHLTGTFEKNGGIWTEEDERILNLMRKGTQNEIKEDTLYRSVDASAVLGKLSDIDYENLMDMLRYGEKAIPKNEVEKIRNKLNVVGKEIKEPRFMSTTKDKDIALNWGDFTGSDKSIVLELKLNKGVKGVDLEKFDLKDNPQKEVLLEDGLTYRIKGFEIDDGQLVFKAEIMPKNNLQNNDENGILFRNKGYTHRKSIDNRKVIDKPTFNKLSKSIINKGGKIVIVTEENGLIGVLQGNRAATMDTVIYLREDMTISEVLEERKHFFQNISGKFDKFESDVRIVKQEIEANEYLLSVKDKFKIPLEEIEETKELLEYYQKCKIEIEKEGRWVE